MGRMPWSSSAAHPYGGAVVTAFLQRGYCEVFTTCLWWRVNGATIVTFNKVRGQGVAGTQAV